MPGMDPNLEVDDRSFMQKFIDRNAIPREAIDHFSSIPWTARYLQNPLYEDIPTFSRVLKPTGEDFFFSKTINTPETIPFQLTLKLRDLETPDGTRGSSHNHTAQADHKAVTKVPEHPDTIMLLRLGSPGLDGHPKTMHGGVLCAILDETMGLCVMLHNTKDTGPRDSLFTVKLETTYRAAVPTPGDVLVRCWLTKQEGRKWWSRGQIVNQEGLVMTEAEGLWVTANKIPAKI